MDNLFGHYLANEIDINQAEIQQSNQNKDLFKNTIRCKLIIYTMYLN